MVRHDKSRIGGLIILAGLLVSLFVLTRFAYNEVDAFYYKVQFYTEKQDFAKVIEMTTGLSFKGIAAYEKKKNSGTLFEVKCRDYDSAGKPYRDEDVINGYAVQVNDKDFKQIQDRLKNLNKKKNYFAASFNDSSIDVQAYENHFYVGTKSDKIFYTTDFFKDKKILSSFYIERIIKPIIYKSIINLCTDDNGNQYVVSYYCFKNLFGYF